MGLPLEDVPYIPLAEKWGAGSTKLSSEDLIHLNKPEAGSVYPEPLTDTISEYYTSR